MKMLAFLIGQSLNLLQPHEAIRYGTDDGGQRTYSWPFPARQLEPEADVLLSDHEMPEIETNISTEPIAVTPDTRLSDLPGLIDRLLAGYNDETEASPVVADDASETVQASSEVDPAVDTDTDDEPYLVAYEDADTDPEVVDVEDVKAETRRLTRLDFNYDWKRFEVNGVHLEMSPLEADVLRFLFAKPPDSRLTTDLLLRMMRPVRNKLDPSLLQMTIDLLNGHKVGVYPLVFQHQEGNEITIELNPELVRRVPNDYEKKLLIADYLSRRT